MSSPQQSNTSADDATLALALISGVLLAAGWAIWFFYSASISYYVMYLRYYQAIVFTEISAEARAAVAYITSTPADQVSAKALFDLSNAALRVWSVIVAVFFGVCYWAVRKNSSAWVVRKFRRFGKGNDLEELIEIQAHEWKTILPITVDNPADESDEEVQRLYAEALHPEEWVDQQGLPLHFNGIDLGMTLFIISAQDQAGAPLFTLDHLAVAWGDGRIPLDERGLARPDSIRQFIDQHRPKLLSELRSTPRAIRHRGKDLLINDTHLVGCLCLLVPMLSALTRQFRSTWSGFATLSPPERVLAAAMLYRGAVERVMCHNMLLVISEIWTQVRRQHKGKGTWTVQHFHDALLGHDRLMEMCRHAFNLANGADPDQYVSEIPAQDIYYMTRDKARPSLLKPSVVLRPSFWGNLISKIGKGQFSGIFADLLPRGRDLAARRKRIKALSGRMREGRRVCDNHSFTETSFIALYDWSKKRGSIMAPAEFMWLRAANRPLWYILNSNGRPKPFTEAAAIYSHWIAETEARGPLQIPQISQSLRGIVEYFYEKWVAEKNL